MSRSEVRFGIDWNDSFSAHYPVGQLHLGALVYVSFDGLGGVDRLEPEQFERSIPHCVVGYGSVGPNVTLSTGPRFQPDRHLHIWSFLSSWITLEQFDKAIAISNASLPIRRLHITSVQERSIVHLIGTVFRRIEFCNRLFELDEQDKLWADGVPLMVYLYLTCFDLLGQTEPFINFGDWVKREEGITGLEAMDRSSNNTAFSLWQRHNELFGNKRSFYNFILRVLDEVQRRNLLDSIIWKRRPYPPDMSEKEFMNDQEKIKALYATRNDYTHSVKYYSDGVISGDTSRIRYGDIVYRDKIVRTGFLNWPHVLKECVLKGMANRVLLEIDRQL